MNIRIKEKNLRFKITQTELDDLMRGDCLEIKTVILDKSLVVAIKPQIHGDVMETKFTFNQYDAHLDLLIPSSNIHALFDLGKNRDGLKQKMGDTSVTLQVDMKEACHA